MAHITLITGGTRSGKSLFGQQMAERQAGTRLFLATCPVMDDEMAQRIRRHRQGRQGGNWQTIEETVAIAAQLDRAGRYDTVLIDCLTLWINNLMFHAGQGDMVIDEDRIVTETTSLLAAARRHPGRVIMISNEVGLGIVPDNQQARLYRDLVGRCNQCVAGEADAVYLVCSGLPLQIKGENHAM